MKRTPALLASALALVTATDLSAQEIVHTYSLPGWTGEFGIGLCSLGDLDGDGLPEAAISQSPIHGGSGLSRVGILRGGDGALLQEFNAPANSSWYGFSVACLADLDGDGGSEVLIGAPGDPIAPNVFTYAEVRTGAGALQFTMTGAPGSGFGTSGVGLGDVDGDGFADFAIGAPLDDTGANDGGRIHIHSGQSGLELFTITGVMPSQMLGQSLALLPDQDGDSVGDLLAGAPGANRAYIYSGASGALLRTFMGPGGSRAFGYSVGVVGDLDGDSLADVVIGDPERSGQTGSNEGVAHVISNGSTNTLFEHFGGFAGDHMGHSVTGVGDLNGDGLGDYMVGAPLLTSGSFFPAGFIRVYSGADGSEFFSVFGPGVASACGFAMDALGDFDGDGLEDVMVAAPGANRVLVIRAGEQVGTQYCFGDVGGLGCPCGNTNDGSVDGGLAGCANGSSPGGASLKAAGATSVAAGTFRLFASGLVPNATGLYFQGTQQVNGGLGQVFGDGLRCVSGPIKRLEIVTSTPGGASTSSVNIAIAGAVLAGDTRDYQLWYRDPGGSPCGLGFNLTNAVEIVWTP